VPRGERTIKKKNFNGGKTIMSKKNLILLLIAALTLSLAFAVTTSFAVDKGEAEIILNPDGKKPVKFPHAKHQEKNACGVCHHYIDDKGERVICDDGTARENFQPCDSCHKEGFQNEKLDSWKEIGHERCKGCHTQMKDQGAPTKCNDCHIKK
jgi:hypothetical protein